MPHIVVVTSGAKSFGLHHPWGYMPFWDCLDALMWFLCCADVYVPPMVQIYSEHYSWDPLQLPVIFRLCSWCWWFITGMLLFTPKIPICILPVFPSCMLLQNGWRHWNFQWPCCVIHQVPRYTVACHACIPQYVPGDVLPSMDFNSLLQPAKILSPRPPALSKYYILPCYSYTILAINAIIVTSSKTQVQCYS